MIISKQNLCVNTKMTFMKQNFKIRHKNGNFKTKVENLKKCDSSFRYKNDIQETNFNIRHENDIFEQNLKIGHKNEIFESKSKYLA